MILTLLPYPSFRDSVQCLSDHHLENQRIHVLHIVETLHMVEESRLPDEYLEKAGDQAPVQACAMWEGYETQLCEYGLEASEEWSVRHATKDPLYQALADNLEWSVSEDSKMSKPPWFGNVDVHLGHQGWLVREDPIRYRELFKVDYAQEFIWPTARA